ncbi:MAG TPA: hypothetical protein VEG29_08460 [Candidatus Binatia bacterium]|nr:hypothetical protein [Candidatus Binatia bacterium]
MAQPALGSGNTAKRRALFGLLDRNGWAWASLKALFWFNFIVLLMGYLPDRAYYFTVFSTIQVGIMNQALTPVNFCPPSNGNLPCPAPPGSSLAWQSSPSELALPAPRRDGAVAQVGTHLLYVGGTDGTAASDQVYEADIYASSGNFSSWRQGPKLPAARTKASVGFFGGSVFVIGGDDASGKPTTTAWYITPDATTGELGDWQVADGGTAADGKTKRPNLTLPAPRAGAAFVAAADGIIIIGGSDGTAPTTTVWKSTIDATSGIPQAYVAQAPLVDARTDAAAQLDGNWIYVYGGVDASGPTAEIERGDVTAGTSGSQVSQWGTPTNAGANLPAPRTDMGSFQANGNLYLVGGTDGTSFKTDMWWATPDGSGNISSWSQLAQSDLPTGVAGGSAISGGANAFIIGGETSQGIQTGSWRANLAPMPPFFQLGLPFGATIPGLQIGGEIGQQLGYLAAAGVATGNFVLLLGIGWVYAHQEQTRAFMTKVRNRRKA